MIIEYKKRLSENKVYMPQVLSPVIAELQTIIIQLNNEIERLKRTKQNKVNINI